MAPDSKRKVPKRTGSPGSHPHADQPNWRPATTIEEYLQNCREGLEVYSERQVSKILGMPRAKLWRAKMLAAIPGELFERLLAQPNPPKVREMANIGRLLSEGSFALEVETCPHCGGVTRERAGISLASLTILKDWRA
jgi:hypothetical protein